MSKEMNYKGSVGYVQKCGGIPAYPAKHPRLDKMLESISDERIRKVTITKETVSDGAAPEIEYAD